MFRDTKTGEYSYYVPARTLKES